ncbi:hypothetical protein AXG93_4846s1000 [Marchantia polymorpha subsp. ruderalis]|uniref:Uncharacterized protein n=1 Tax=Marchantia polymorpha subsp. ruderalis TaxID=1480154 RepID=A0A176VD41_MARPO|nr:hypothetical protein AXG93_4846s1000 [Marchantia polymorpha subsp. ruderalis]
MAPPKKSDKVRKYVPLKVEVLLNREKLERRLQKIRKVVTDDEEDLMLEVRRAETEIKGIRQLRFRPRPKRKLSQGLVVIKASNSSVEKTVGQIIDTPKVATGKSTHPVMTEVPSAVLVKVSIDVTVEPSKEGTEMVSPNSLSSERTRSVGSEDLPQPKIGVEVVTEVTLSEAILEQIVAEVGGTLGNQVEEPGPPPSKKFVSPKNFGERL